MLSYRQRTFILAKRLVSNRALIIQPYRLADIFHYGRVYIYDWNSPGVRGRRPWTPIIATDFMAHFHIIPHRRRWLLLQTRRHRDQRSSISDEREICDWILADYCSDAASALQKHHVRYATRRDTISSLRLAHRYFLGLDTMPQIYCESQLANLKPSFAIERLGARKLCGCRRFLWCPRRVIPGVRATSELWTPERYPIRNLQDFTSNRRGSKIFSAWICESLHAYSGKSG